MRRSGYLTVVIVSWALLSLISGPAMAVHEREERGPNIFSEISERVSMGGLVVFDYYWADVGLLPGSPLGKDFSQSDVGTWFYQFKFINNNTGVVVSQTDGTDNFIVQDVSGSPFTIAMENYVGDPDSQGWGFNFTFNLSVWSDSDQNVTVILWRSQTGSEPFLRMANYTQNFSLSDYTNITFEWDAQPNDTNPLTGSQDWYWKSRLLP